MKEKTGDHTTAASATMTGFFDRFRKKIKIGALLPKDRIDGKTCLVTGSSSGLGKAAALALAKRGGYIVMAVRSKIPEAGEEITKKSGSNTVEMMHLDLCSFDSVISFCDEIKRRKLHFDIAVFNAGVVAGGDRKTENGFDEMLQVNFLSKFILVNRLIEDGAIDEKSRVIFTSSEAHRSAENADFAKIGEYHEYSMKGSVAEYGYTKLLLTTFFMELVRRFPDVSFFALCPGPVNSNIAREAPKILHPLMKFFFLLFFRSPKKAAEAIEFFSCSPDLAEKSGMYIHLMEEKPVAPDAVNPDNGKVLWERSTELVREKKG